MKTSIPYKAVSSLFFFVCLNHYALFGFASAPDNAVFNLTEIATGIFVHQGQHLSIEDPANDDIANIGFIMGEKCIAVIDTGGSVAMGEQLLAAIRTQSSLPICYVINTHVHFDHVLGNAAFTAEKPEYLGHQNLVAEMQANRDFFLQQFTPNLGEAGADAVIGPDVSVSESLEIDLGNRVLTLIAHPLAHSHSDLSVYDSKTKTLWLADLLFKERIPVLGGSLRGWIKLLDGLKNMEIEQLIPGHGPSVLAWPDGLADQRRYLQTLLKQTRAAIAAGQFMEDIVENVATEEKKSWLLYEENHKRNVTRAFTELEWEE